MLAKVWVSVGLAAVIVWVAIADEAHADDLYMPGMTQSLAADRKPSKTGDLLTIVIVAAADSSTTMTNGSQKTSSLGGRFAAGRIDQSANLSLGGSYNGQGSVSRSERFVTQMTATVEQVLPGGDLLISGQQQLNINGEKTTVKVRGRVRLEDIDAQDQVQSNRIADAQIDYNGKGFVSRSARPGLIHRLFSFLGLM